MLKCTTGVITVMTVLSGELDRDSNKQIKGIKNGQYVFMMIDNNGKPLTMVNNSARLYEDNYIDVVSKEAFDAIKPATQKGSYASSITQPASMITLME